MRRSKQLILLLIFISIGNLAPILASLYLQTTGGMTVFAALRAHSEGFAATTASFAFSMLGFLAAAMALLSMLAQSGPFHRYRQRGYLSVLLCGAAITMLELAIAFVASLRLFFDPVTDAKLGSALIMTVAALSMVLLTVAPILGLQIRAANDPAACDNS